MPLRLLRDRRVVEDEWTRWPATSTAAADAIASQPVPSAILLPFEQWLADKPHWLASSARLGVTLLPPHRVELLAPDLARIELVAVEFPGPSEGRGYTQARLLRERHHFAGELRAVGYVRRDQLFFLARCGFDAFELPEAELPHAQAAFETFSAEYQPSKRQRR